jgi:hypothetical protein
MMARITMIGEKSMPPKKRGSLFRMRKSTGSVMELRNRTMGL